MLLRIFDIIGSALILTGLWGLSRSRNFWLIYMLGTVFFLYVAINKGLIGLTVMGFATFAAGIKNYIVSKKKNIK